MKLLVTGGAGFIGSHLVDELIELGHEVTIIDNLSTGKVENINPAANFIQSDLHFFKMAQLHDYHFDAVFHLAAMARIQPSIATPLPFDMANVHGTVVALEIARRFNAKFIFSSSSSIYGPREDMPEREEDTPNPQNPYALQKWIGEQYVHLYENLYGLRTTIFRYFNVYGERQLTDGAYATVVGVFERQFASGESFTIVDDGEQKRDFTYVKDVVAANVLALENKDSDGFTLNVGTGSNTTVNEVANAISATHPRITGIKRDTEVRETLADNTHLRALGWTPSTDVLTWLKSRHTA